MPPTCAESWKALGWGFVYVPRRISSRHMKRFGNGVAHNQDAFSQKPGKAAGPLPAVTISSP